MFDVEPTLGCCVYAQTLSGSLLCPVLFLQLLPGLGSLRLPSLALDPTRHRVRCNPVPCLMKLVAGQTQRGLESLPLLFVGVGQWRLGRHGLLSLPVLVHQCCDACR